MRPRVLKLLILAFAAGCTLLGTALLAPYEVRIVQSTVPIQPERRIALSPLFVPPERMTESEKFQLINGGPGAKMEKTIKLQWHYLLAEWSVILVIYGASFVWIFRRPSITDNRIVTTRNA